MMTRRMSRVGQSRLTMFCCQDRDFLLRAYCRSQHLAEDGLIPWEDLPAPADLLDEIIEDILMMRIVSVPLPGHLLGRCDFETRRIILNTRMAEITVRNTKVEGVMNSTKAHELAHVRFPEHERQVREELADQTLPLFGASRPVIACDRDWEKERRTGPRIEREYEADHYASLFLVPQEQLVCREAARELARASREQESIPSKKLWARVLTLADEFKVTGALMKRRLVELGWIVGAANGKDLEVSPEPFLPLIS